MASELNLNVRSDGYVKVQDLLKLNTKTFTNIPVRAHTVDDIREAVRNDNKQRFSLLEDNGELLIRANQGHTVTTVKTESLLKPILSAEEIPVCVHGTYNKFLESILEHGLKRMKRLHIHFSCGLPRDSEVISGMRWDVNVLIFLDVKKALEGPFYVLDDCIENWSWWESMRGLHVKFSLKEYLPLVDITLFCSCSYYSDQFNF